MTQRPDKHGPSSLVDPEPEADEAAPGTTDEADPETAGKATPDTTGETASEATDKADPDTTGETALEATDKADPDTTGKAAPEATDKATPDTTGKAAPEATDKATPDTTGKADPETDDDAAPAKSGKGSASGQVHTETVFRPHGLGSKRDRRRAIKAARRRQVIRRRILIAAPIAVVIIAAAVVGIIYATRTPSVAVTGAFGKQPKVTIPKIKPPATMQVTSLVQGHGGAVKRGDLAVVNLVGYAWNASTHKQVISSFSQHEPVGLPVGQTIPGLDKSIAGKQAGSRLLLSIPPKDGFGTSGNPQLGVKGSDTVLFVVDVLGSYPKTASAHGQQQQLPANSGLPTVTAAPAGSAPTVTIPKSAPPQTLQVKTLIQGTGPTVGKGKLIAAQYDGLLWRTGKPFDSSWQHGAPVAFPIGAGKVIPGWDHGLVGQRVGSRVMLVLPPKEGYGSQGNPQAGIKGNDTLVFVVDILGQY